MGPFDHSINLYIDGSLYDHTGGSAYTPPPPPVLGAHILMESGSSILLENGNYMGLEN